MNYGIFGREPAKNQLHSCFFWHFSIRRTSLRNMIATENTPKSKIEIAFETDGMSLTLVSNPGPETSETLFEAQRSFINFYFCNEGSAEFAFGPGYARNLGRRKNFLIYDPEKGLPFN